MNNIKNIVSTAINKIFTKLIIEQKDLIIEYLTKICIVLSQHFIIENFEEQLKLNDFRDVYSLLVLLFPYYDLNKSKEITDLGEIFYNKNNKSAFFTSTFYYDHDINTNQKIKEYFETNLLLIKQTFATIKNKLATNWLNIFPYTMENYMNSDIFKQFANLWLNHNFPYENDEFKLGYNTLYGTVKSFLYDDIKNIKWMIYDIIDDKTNLCPLILYITKKLGIQNICNEPWNKLSKEKKEKIKNKWYEITNTTHIFKQFSAMILFYLRWEKDNDKLDSLNLSKECMNLIKNNIDNINNENNENNENEDDDENIEEILYDRTKTKMNIFNCIIQISKTIKIKNLYEYIYTCCQQFKYTWYGYKCMDENNSFLDVEVFLNNYLIKRLNTFERVKTKSFHISLKMTYNFIKSLLHVINESKYKPISNNNSWYSLDLKIDFINKLNFVNVQNWFNIKGNITRLYNFEKNDPDIDALHTVIIETLFSNIWIPHVIFQCLVYNGILTYFKFNPQLTDSKNLPDKNKQISEWKKVFDERLDISKYENSYHFLDNKKLKTHKDFVKIVKNSKWFANFGADWICQIQIYHHFIHQRVLFITGATGAGKSTVYPFLILYALKIINFNNNGKVFCTQPRIQPTKANSVRIAEGLGIPIVKKKSNDTNFCKKTDYEKSNIDYIQYQYKEAQIVDDFYHPTLRLLTDGLLYALIQREYIFKKSTITKSINSQEPFRKNNLFDVLLIDESHEHNTYIDMILTISKFGVYINNQITLGIISATMDDDESIYRKFFLPINDDWKYPFNIDLKHTNFSRTLLDRRIHLSVPFGGTNFKVTEIESIGRSELDIINEILLTSNENEDILVFKPGTAEINKLVREINNNTPPDVIAIPFLSTISSEILENIIKEIAKPDIRNSINYNKKICSIEQICDDIPKENLVPKGTYKRFIIIATNIAEASITIDTLKYVIDDGKQKINFYYVNTNQSKLLVKDISEPNYKQRRGRVGRSKPGIFYHTYDLLKLPKKVIYKICSENINDKILNLLPSDKPYDELFEFSNSNNPYLIFNSDNSNNLDNLPFFLQEQYCWAKYYNDVLYYEPFYKQKPDIIDYTDIVYPDFLGKYNANILIDEEGKFYIIHPNENDVERNMPVSLRIIKNELYKSEQLNYRNKVSEIINFFKILNIVNDKNNLTTYGSLISNCSAFFDISFNLILTILDLFIFGYSIKDKNNEIFNNIIWYCIFSTDEKINNEIKLSQTQKVYSDFLAKGNLIPNKFLNYINLLDIIDELNVELDNLALLINDKVKKIINIIPINQQNIYELMLNKYYVLKIKIEILEELKNEKSVLFVNTFKNIHIKGKINKNSSLLKYINMSYLPKISQTDLNIVNSLNEYEKICFFICKNNKLKILLKITGTDFYINYFNRNYTNLYKINSIQSMYNTNKKILLTNVYNEYRNNLIIYLQANDNNTISNIMWIPAKILYLLQNIHKTSITRNATINKHIIQDIYGEIQYDIYKKIDIINDYILNK